MNLLWLRNWIAHNPAVFLIFAGSCLTLLGGVLGAVLGRLLTRRWLSGSEAARNHIKDLKLEIRKLNEKINRRNEILRAVHGLLNNVEMEDEE